MNRPNRHGPVRPKADLSLAACTLVLATQAMASPPEVVTEDLLEPDRVYSPFVGRDHPDEVLFGDTHFHTNLSFDAGLVGTSLDLHAGYRFARGEPIRARPIGQIARFRRWCRRNPLPVALAATILLAILSVGAALIKAVEAGCDVLYDEEREAETADQDGVPQGQRRQHGHRHQDAARQSGRDANDPQQGG